MEGPPKPRPPTLHFTITPPSESGYGRDFSVGFSEFSESDVIDHNPVRRSPRRQHIKPQSVRANRVNTGIDAKDDARYLQSDFPGTGTFRPDLKPEALKHIADTGNHLAELAYANVIAKGVELPQDIESALKYYKSAADANIPEAAFKYSINLMGYGTGPSDLREAILYLEKSADLGYPEGQYEYGQLLLTGKHITKNIPLAFVYIRKSADNGFALAQFKLSRALMRGKDIERNPQESVTYLKKASNQNFPPAQNRLAQLYANGVYIEKDVKKAVELFKNAAESGLADAQNAYGQLLYDGECGLTKNVNLAITYYEKAAAQNHPLALYNLSYIYIQDNSPNLEKGIECLKQSANLGYDKALYNLGLAYEQGKYINRDMRLAAYYYEIAANKGNPKAKCNYAKMLLDGEFIPKDEKKAEVLFKEAADKGSVIAQIRYAELLERSPHAAIQRKIITDYYTMAAQSGNPFAAFSAGTYLETSDRRQAAEFYQKAASAGVKDASYRLACLLEADGGDWRPPMERAAAEGNLDAKVRLAVADVDKSPEDHKRCVEVFKAAAQEGHVVGMYHFGVELYKQDKGSGILMLREAANGNYAPAARKLGELARAERRPQEAIRHFSRAGELGDHEAEYIVAQMYESGEGCARSPAKAHALIEAAAKGGVPGAMFRYSEMLESGDGAIKSRSESIKYLKAAADVGQRDAVLKITRVLLDTHSKQALEYAEKAASLDPPDADSIMVYARLLHNNDDIEKSEEMMKKAADMNNSEAQFLYGKMLLDNGDSRGLDFLINASNNGASGAYIVLAEYYESQKSPKAKHYYRLAAESGNPAARRIYAAMVSEDKRKSSDIMLRHAADDGDAEAEYIIAKTMKKTEEVLAMMTKAASAGHAEAQLYVSKKTKNRAMLESAAASGLPSAMTELGMTVMQDNPGRGRALLECAAERGDVEAHIALADMGIDVEQHLRAAADSGDHSAMFRLSEVYENNGKKDKARSLLKKAAKEVPKAMYKMYTTDPEGESARAWLIKAANRGVVEAKLDLARLLEKEDQKGDALKLFRSALKQSGSVEAMRGAARLLEALGKEEDAAEYVEILRKKKAV